MNSKILELEMISKPLICSGKARDVKHYIWRCDIKGHSARP
jgi:hypothetical protein